MSRSRLLPFAAAGLLALHLSTPALATTSYSLFGDFSATTNPNGAWAYGHAGTPGASFTAYSLAAASNLDGFHVGLQGWSFEAATTPMLGINVSGSLIDDGNVSLPTGVVLLHGQGTGPAASEVRWTAPEAGTYEVTAVFTGHQRNMLANVAVFDGSSSLYSSNLAGLGATASFTGVLDVLAGGTLTFAVNRDGPDPGGFAGNWTGLELTIAAVPEPGTGAMLLAGLAAAAALRRRLR
jgi:hypothetical protein